MNALSKLLAVAAALLLAACGSPPPVGGAPGLQIASVSGLPEPTFTDYMPEATEALVRPYDQLSIEVFGVEELSREVRVSAAGSFDYPLVGTVNASGRTPEEISLEIENRLRGSYVRNPDVSSQITERAQRIVTVGGEVTRPGRFPVEGPITLLEAVALGGGMDEYATRDEVLVFRTVGEDRYIGVYNVQGIARGNYPDPTVYPNDIVVVGDSPGRRRLEEILQIAGALGTPLVVLERALRGR